MTTIWILKGIIAVIFTFTGISKLFIPKSKLIEKGMKALTDIDEDQIRLVGLLEIFGVIGLLLPGLLNYSLFVSIISAFGLSLTMIGAGLVNYKLRLSIVPNITVFIICVLIAILDLKYV